MRHCSPRESQTPFTSTWRTLPMIAAFAVIVALLALAVPGWADPLAVAVEIKGSVTVTRAGGGKPQKAALGRGLERGDKIQVGPGGSVTLFFNDGNVIELGEKSTMTIGGRVGAATGSAAAKSGLPSEVFARVSRFVASDSHKSGMLAVAPLRGGEDAPQPMLLSPRRTSVRETRPSFTWRSVDGATRYQVSVTGDQGELWSRETGATMLDYPADAPELAAGGDYSCSVRALSETAPLLTDTETFTVLPAEETKQVGNDLQGIEKATGTASSSAAMYIAASYLVGRGLYDEAVAQFEALVKVTPDAPGPHEALGNVYRTIGLTEQAAGEYKRALELSQSQ